MSFLINFKNIYKLDTVERSFVNYWLITQHTYLKNIKRLLKILVISREEYPGKTLVLKDFNWVFINDKKRIGYFSYKVGNYEICIDEEYPCWIVSLANKHGEVLEDIEVPSKEEALREAGKYYRRFIYELE